MNKQKIKCLFGYHNYTVRKPDQPGILLCSRCMRAGYYQGETGVASLWEYDEHENAIYRRWPDGFEAWYEYDENNNRIYGRDSNGNVRYQKYDKDGTITEITRSSKN